MKTKNLLPVMAIVFAVGLAFATVKVDVDPLNDYIRQGTNWQPISEIPCEPQGDACLVRLNPNGPEYQVYDAPDVNTAKEGNGIVFELY